MKAKEFYDKVNLECSEVMTVRFSTNYSLGIKMLPKKLQEGIFGVYAFTRAIDEIVDNYLEVDRISWVEKYKRAAHDAVEARVSTNPILHSFQLIFHKYNLKKEWIDGYLKSMEIDSDFDRMYKGPNRFEDYKYSSIEIPSLMCLKVLCDGDEELYSRLEAPMRYLFSAFQRINDLRDLTTDYERGRIYFPNVDYENFDVATKQMIEKDAQKDLERFALALNEFPEETKTCVWIWYETHRQLLEKIKAVTPETLKRKRMRISNFEKFLVLVPARYLIAAFLLVLFLFVLHFQMNVNPLMTLAVITLMICTFVYKVGSAVFDVLLS